MISARVNAQQKQIAEEKDRIIVTFAHNTFTKQRAVTKVAKSLLLNAPYLLNGRSYDMKAKSLGAGVYELSLKRMDIDE